LQELGIEYHLGEEYANYINSIRDDVSSLVLRLKSYYNRPRPYQLAYYSDLSFNPFETITGNSPAYPSGHACQSYLAVMVVADRYPEKKKELLDLGKRIADTRLVLGVHYPSDNIFGKHIAAELFKNPAIRTQLKLTK
jgi:acid phosphatase (class A)